MSNMRDCHRELLGNKVSFFSCYFETCFSMKIYIQHHPFHLCCLVALVLAVQFGAQAAAAKKVDSSTHQLHTFF